MRLRTRSALCLLLTIAVHLDERRAGGVAAAVQRNTAGPRPVYIGGFFSISSHPFFESLPLTVQAAMDHVNNLTGILDGYQLRMRWNWTQGSPANALRIVNDFVQDGPPISMMWGPMFSSVAVVVNEVLPRYDIVQVITASSSTLKDRSRYPLTVQIATDEDVMNPAKVAFVKRMGWRKVALIFEDNEYFRQNTANLAELLDQSGITVLATETVTDIDHPDEQIHSLQRHDARIIIVGFYLEAAAKLFCKIYEVGLFGAKYVWILPGWYPDGWWRDVTGTTCTVGQMAATLDLHLGFDGDQSVSDVSLIDFKGVKPFPGQLDYLRRLHMVEDNPRDTYSYDCLFAIALALNASIADLAALPTPRGLDEFSYGDKEMAGILLSNTLKTDFVGMTDRVFIDDRGVRISEIYVEQLQGGYPIKVAKHLTNGDYKEIANTTIKWRGAAKPVDGKTETRVFVTISIPFQIGIFSSAILGVLLALVFLGLNFALRNQRAVKISSPQINNLIILGCLLLYSSVLVSGLDTTGLAESTFIVLCYVKVWLICAGMSLSFGSLLVKTYRIFAIFEKAVAKFQKIDLPDRKLISVVMLLVLMDAIITGLWVILGQTTIKILELEPQLSDTVNPDREVYTLPVLRQCGSTNEIYFTGVIYGYKGFLLVFGLFLSWEIRGVNVKGLNDSKYIVLSVYVVALTIILTLPTLQVFVNNVDMYFCIFSIAVVFANTMVLCLVFVPKFALCYTSRGTHLHISMMESSTISAPGTKFSPDETNQLTGLRRTLQKKEERLANLLQEYRALDN